MGSSECFAHGSQQLSSFKETSERCRSQTHSVPASSNQHVDAALLFVKLSADVQSDQSQEQRAQRFLRIPQLICSSHTGPVASCCRFRCVTCYSSPVDRSGQNMESAFKHLNPLLNSELCTAAGNFRINKITMETDASIYPAPVISRLLH